MKRRSVRRNPDKRAGAAKTRKVVGGLPKKTGGVRGRRRRNIKGRMKEVLFVQGGGRAVHDSWDNKLVASLEKGLGPTYRIRYPRMPDEANPRPAAWKKAIDRELRKLSDGVFLVGHSVGAAILMDYLADRTLDRRLAGVFLIATPFIGDGGWPSDDLRPTKEAAAELSDGAPLHLYQGGTMRPCPTLISACSRPHFRTRPSAASKVATTSSTTTSQSSRTTSGSCTESWGPTSWPGRKSV